MILSIVFAFIVALKAILEGMLSSHVPVVAIVAVIGTTGQSAVDPLSDIFALRDDFRLKVILFSL